MKRMVCGFLFNPELTQVALILKKRGPDPVVGRWNGLGGKINTGEGIRSAMSREFLEESGVWIDPSQWMCFHTEQYMNDTNNKVYFLCAESPAVGFCSTNEDEKVFVFDITYPDAFNGIPVIYNLPYLIPMAISWLKNPGDRYFEG